MIQNFNGLMSFALSLPLALSLTLASLAFAPVVQAEELTAQQHYERGMAENASGDYARAVADYNAAIEKNPQFWKAYANRSAARFNCHDYQGALQDINIGIAHLPPTKGLTDLKANIEQTIASSSAQAENLAARRAAAQRMLLNAQLGISPLGGFGADMSSPAYQIERLAAIVRARGGKIPSDLVKPIPNDLVVPMKGQLITPIGGSSAPAGGSSGPSPFTATTSKTNTMVSTATSKSTSSSTSSSSKSAPSSAGSESPFTATTSTGSVASAATGDASMTAQQFFDRGCEKGKANDLAGAIKDYDQCILLNPKHGPAYANRGSARFNSGDLDGGLSDFNKAVDLMPDTPGVKELRDQIMQAMAQLKALKEAQPH